MNQPTSNSVYIGAQTPDTPTRPREPVPVSIRRVTNGWIVRVGCQRFVSQRWEEIADGLALYYEDERAAIKKFCPKGLMGTGQSPQPIPDPQPTGLPAGQGG